MVCRLVGAIWGIALQMNISFRTRFFVAILYLAVTEVVTGAPSPATYFPGQIVVKFKATPPGLTVAPVHIAGAQVKAKMPRLGWQLVQLPAGVEVQAALEYYRKLTNVAYA